MRSKLTVPGELVLGAFFVLLALTAMRGEWITFPLRAPLKAGDLFLTFKTGHPLALGKLYQALLGAGLLLVLVSRAASVTLLCAAFGLVAAVPVQTAVFRVSWVQAYLTETSERLFLGAYMNEHFASNESPEPAFTPITQFQDASEQLQVGFVMLGYGWYIALAATFALLVLVLRRWDFPYRIHAALCLVGVFSALLVGPPMLALLGAEAGLASGDRALIDGDGSKALADYTRAIETNPALGVSDPFLLKVSMALNVASGGRHALGFLGQDLGLANHDAGAENRSSLYANARQRLLEQEAFEPAGAPTLEAPLLEAARRLDSELWRAEGTEHARQHHYSLALGAFSRMQQRPDSTAAFYLADAYLEQGSGEPAVGLLHGLDVFVGQKSIHADVLCTLGDAYTVKGDLVSARIAYQAARDLDKLNNFRATKALTGS